MSEKKSIDSRRKLLKSLAAGSGAVIAGKSLPDNWAKPVVDSVLLPVHAQTSQVSPLSCISTGAPFGSNTPPGPDVDDTNQVNVPWMVTVTPAPVAPDDVVTAGIYLDGVEQVPPQPFQLAPDGTFAATGFFVGFTGVMEFRFVWGTETCSLFWNTFTTVPPLGGGSASLT